MHRRPLAIALILGFLPAWMPVSVFAQPTGEPPLPEDLPQLTVTTNGEQHRVPNIAETRLEQLRFQESGVFIDRTGTLPPSAWNLGETAADAITIGGAQDTFRRQITIDQVARIGGFDPLQFPIDAIPPVAGASLGDLAKAVPNLGNTRLRDSFLTQVTPRRKGVIQGLQGTVFGNQDVQAIAQFITDRPELSQVPINSLIKRDWGGVAKGAVRVALVRLLRERGTDFGSIAVGSLDLNNPAGAIFAGASIFQNLKPNNAIQRFIRNKPGGTINDFIRDNPQFQHVPITALGDISSLRVGDIKGLATTNLGQIDSARAHALSSLPGAGDLKLGQLVKGLNQALPVLGKLGPAYGSNDGVEGVANRSVSGGTPSNRFRAKNCGGGDCAHFEFDSMTGSPITAGRTWVGGQQTTRGGVGPLAAVNGGKEPAGIKINDNFPFKFVIDDIDGKAGGKPGTATQSLYFQVCAKPPFAPKTCTPHVLRFPLQTVEENDVVIAAVTPEPKTEKIQPFFIPKDPEPKALGLPKEAPEKAMTKAGPVPFMHPYGARGARVLTKANIFGAPRAYRKGIHWGLDLFGRPGHPIHAPASGVVKRTYHSAKCNHVVEIEHSGGYLTRHVHMRKVIVKGRQKLKRGQIFAYEGAPLNNCGTGSHLHYVIKKNGTPINPICVDHQPALPTRAQDGTPLTRYRKC